MVSNKSGNVLNAPKRHIFVMSKYIKYIGEDTLLDLIKTQAKREAHKIHIFCSIMLSVFVMLLISF